MPKAPSYTANMTSIADLRKSYERAELDESASHADPLTQFDQWLKEAIATEVPEPNAMTLATVGSDLRPSTRVVLIKGYDAQGIVWYTNFESRKGKELAGNPFAALQFHWVELERVVRIEGRAVGMMVNNPHHLGGGPPAAAEGLQVGGAHQALVTLPHGLQQQVLAARVDNCWPTTTRAR